MASIAVAVVAIMVAPATAGSSAIAGFIPAAGATSILGVATATSAVSIAVAGGIGALSKLRVYKLEKITDTKIKLTRR